MTDIFDEVEADLRRERAKRAWDKYGIYVIGVAVLIVAVTAGYRGWEYWQTSREQAAGDRFMAALELAQAQNHTAAIAELEAFVGDAPERYRTLARLRLASEFAVTGDVPAAIDELEGVAADGGVDRHLRDLARLRAAYLYLDAGDAAAAQGQVDGLAAAAGPWSYPAKEIMGLADYAQGQPVRARGWFEDIEEDAAAPPDIRQRAQLMLTVLRSTAPAPAAAREAPGDAAPVGEPAAGEGSAGETGEVQ